VSLPCPVSHLPPKENAMRFWIECTRFETGRATHINIAPVGSMWCDGDRTVLAFVGGEAKDRGQ
jgi:hypothetical protein